MSREEGAVHAGAAVRAAGRRMTRQRRLVLDALERTAHHTTAEEVVRLVRESLPEIDPSTVYRNLEALEELGLVSHTHFDDRATRWHRADIERHGHLVCGRCGAEQHVPLGTFDPLVAELRSTHGFRADLAHSAIVGLCRACEGVPSPE